MNTLDNLNMILLNLQDRNIRFRANGTDAIGNLRSLNITHGHEVIIPTNSFVATAIAVSRVGATPIFVDNDEYYLMDTKSIKKKITKTKAIIAVNLYGQMANLKILLK